MNIDIPIHGRLTAPIIEDISDVIEQELDSAHSVTLSVNSDGGSSDAARAFYLRFLPFQSHIKAHILHAGSAAALMSLVACHRGMSPTGAVTLHPGAITIESNSIPEGGKIPHDQIARLIDYRNFYLSVIKRDLRIKPSWWTMLNARNRLTLNPRECLECGFAQAIED